MPSSSPEIAHKHASGYDWRYSLLVMQATNYDGDDTSSTSTATHCDTIVQFPTSVSAANKTGDPSNFYTTHSSNHSHLCITSVR